MNTCSISNSCFVGAQPVPLHVANSFANIYGNVLADAGTNHGQAFADLLVKFCAVGQCHELFTEGLPRGAQDRNLSAYPNTKMADQM